MPTIKMYRSFVLLAEARSVTVAAKRLGVSKSVISRSVKDLEAELDTVLVTTTTQSVKLTSAGQELLPYATRLVNFFDTVSTVLKKPIESPKGYLRVCIVTDFGIKRFSQVIVEFLKQYPEVQIHLDITTDRKKLQSDKYHVRMFVGRLDELESSVHNIGSITMHLVCSPIYIEQHGLPRVPRDINQHDLLCYSGQMRGNEWILYNSRGEEIRISVVGNVVSNSIEVILHTCKQGLGIAYLPSFICEEDIASGELVEVFPELKKHMIDITVGYKKDPLNTTLIQVFIDYLRNAFALSK